MPPKRSKGQTMALDDFLGDERFFSGNWADEDIPLPMAAPSSGDGWGASGMGGLSNAGGPGLGGRVDPLGTVSLPTSPPYTARIQNLSYDVTEASLGAFFRERGLKVESVRLPKDSETGRIRGSGFIDFEDRDSLAQAIDMGSPMILGRIVHISIAEQRRANDPSDGNWHIRREPAGGFGGPSLGRFREREPEPELDWAAARNNNGGFGGPRRGPPPPPEEEFDWSTRRGPHRGGNAGPGGFGPPRTPRPPRQPEPEFDWNVRVQLPSRREHTGGFRRGDRDSAGRNNRNDEVNRGFEEWGKKRAAAAGNAPSSSPSVSASASAGSASASQAGSDAPSDKQNIQKLQRGFAALDIEDEQDKEDEPATSEPTEPKVESVADLQRAERSQTDGSWTKA